MCIPSGQRGRGSTHNGAETEGGPDIRGGGGDVGVCGCGGDSHVAPAVEEVKAELVLGVDDPHEEQAVLLQLGDGQVLDVAVGQLAVPAHKGEEGPGERTRG